MSFKLNSHVTFVRCFARQAARVSGVLLLLASGLMQMPLPAAQAAPMRAAIGVTTTVDEYGSGAGCSLREAIQAANTDTAFGGCLAGTGADTITLPANTYTLSIIGNNEQNNAQGDLDILSDLTIQGATGNPADVVIQGGAGWIDKIIDINPNVDRVLDVTITGVTVQNGNNTSAADIWGGGIQAFGRNMFAAGYPNTPFGSLTLQNNIIRNNTYAGGSVFDDAGGGLVAEQISLTVDNCTFTNNSTTSGYGGGIDIVGINENISITNSTFTGNSSAQRGGAIYIRRTSQVGHPNLAGTITINNNSFVNNSAATYGGGIALWVQSGAKAVFLNVGVHNSIFVGNTAATSGRGFYYEASDTTNVANVSAENNWWGCSTGPSAAPCDTAADISGSGGVALDYNPWFRDLLVATTSPLVVNQSTAITATFLTNSVGGAVPIADLSRILGRPVSWGATLGTLSGTQATVRATGTATGTFQASGAGTASIYARVDNDNTSGASSNILALTVSPANTTTTLASSANPSLVGQAVTFTVSVAGEYGNTPTAPTGNVQFFDGATSLGTRAVDATGQATLVTSALTAGSHTITATYLADANFNGSTSPGLTQVVNASPTVTSVSSTIANGAYTVGEIIPITVTFNMPVTVTGVPQLTLETGTTNRVINYSIGSGTATLTFNYTVQAGDTSSDLDYTAATSLALNGGTIRDATTNTFDVILTLASPGTAGSLGANKAIVIDTVVPTVTNVTSTSTNDTYTTGAIIPITVTFSEVVNVDVTGGTPHLTLETGTVDEGIYYTGGSGTNTLTFTYTVQAGDNSPDLDYIGTFALNANGGTIQDAATNNADLTLASPGAAGSLGANKNIVIDTTAPVITFTSTPTDPTNQSSFTFGFGANETVTGYTCTLSRGAIVLIGPIACSSPVPGSVGSTGTYTFLVSVTDLAGNSGSSSFTWTADLTPPDTTLQPPLPANPASLNNASFTYDGSDTGSGVAAFQCALDGAAFAPCTSPMPQTYTGLSDGSHTFQVRAVDNAGNLDPTPASYTWVVDTVYPAVTMTSAASNPTTISPIPVTVQFTETVTGFAAGDITPANATVNNFTAVDSDTYTFNLTPAGQGLVTADIAAGVAVDSAGNGNTAAPQFSRTFDDVPPDTTIDSQPANPSNSANAVFTFSGTDNLTPPATLTFQCSLDGAAFGACPVNYTGLADVSHTFQVRAVDQVGNSDPTPASYTWVIDTIPPDTTITSTPPNPANSTTAIFAFTGNDGGGTGVTSYACNLDSAGFVPCTSSWTYNGLGDGTHTFQVQATDAANNTDATPASVTWSVDTSSPSVAVSSAATSPTNDPTFSITVTFSEDVTGFTPSTASGDLVIVNGTASNPGGSGTTYTFDLSPSGQGPVTVQVPAGSGQDAAGNGNTVSNLFSITYDSVAPTVTIAPAAGQLDPTSGSPINFTVTFSETVTDFGSDVTDVTVSGTAGATTAAVTGSGTTYNVAVSGMTGGGTVIVSIPAGSAQDAAGNGNSASGNATVTFTPLGITSPNNLTFVAGNLSSFTITTTGAPPPTLTYTFRPPTDTLPSGIGFVDNGNGTATLSGTPALTSVGTYNLTFTASNGVGPDATQDFTLTIDGPPGVHHIDSNASTSGGTIDENEHTSAPITQLLVAFNKAMNADTPADLDDALNVENYSLTRDGSAVIVIDPTITYAAQTATLSVNGGIALSNGRYTLTVEGDIEDTLGAPIGMDFVQIFYVDNAAPSLASFTLQNPSSSLTNADTLVFRATFSEDIQNANAGDFIVSGTTATVTGVAAVTGSSIYDITVSGGNLANLNGTVGLDLAAGQNITDLAGNPLPGSEPATDETYLLNNSYPTVIYGSSTAPEQNSILSVGPTQIVIEFNKDVLAEGSANAATSTANYLLVEAGVNAVFDTIACGGIGGGLRVGDTRITVNSVTYTNSGGTGPFLATLNVNGAAPLLPGTYRLFICGTSSIYDPAGNRLNNGADSVLDFRVQRPRGMPDTGFAPNEVTILPEQPADKAYADLGNLWIEIPKLNLKTDITGVPRKADGWDVTWLHWQVGWLEGSAYPTWEGNTVLTAHGYTADGEAGPFALLKNLSYGETIVIHLGGMKYTYAVRTNLLVNPNDTRWLTKHEELDWITLITCQQYDAKTKSYRYRRVVRAVLLRVEKE